MEAVQDFGRGCQDLAIILMGSVGEGGGRNGTQAGCPVIAFIGGSEKRGGGGSRGDGEQICPCTKCSHVHVAFTLSLFLIYPFCCCSLSRYKKVPQERYSTNLKNFLIRIIYRDIHTFISFGVLGEYAKSLFASSPCTHKSFPRTLEYVLIVSAHTETILCTANNPD